jgi:hypothetical protein
MFPCTFEILCLSDGVLIFLRDIIIFSNSRARWFRIHLPLFQRPEFTKHMGIHFMTWGLLCGWATKDEHRHGHRKACQIVFSVFWLHVLHQNLTSGKLYANVLFFQGSLRSQSLGWGHHQKWVFLWYFPPGPWSLVLTLHVYGASIDGFGDFVCATVHFISLLIDCTLKKIYPL